MQILKQFLKSLVYSPTVSGFEYISTKKIMNACLEFGDSFFTEAYITKKNSIVLCRKCGKNNAASFVLDAHLDTIGFAVSEICQGGYLRLVPLGGIDSNIMPSSEIMIYGKQNITGIVSSIPPHLSGSDKLPDIGEYFIDTGFSDEELKQLVGIGTPAALMPAFTELLGDRLAATGLDDKICIAVCMQVSRLLKNHKLENTDFYIYLSSGEERGGIGSHHIYEEIKPDALVVLDVNFAKEKGSEDGEYGVLGKGAMLSYSAVTSRRLTRFIEDTAAKNRLPLQCVNEMSYTGTNADVEAKAGLGSACAVMSVPLKYMHSSVETADMNDTVTAAKILTSCITEYDKTPICKPIYYKNGGGDFAE